jgi:hypothetical protein
VRWGEIIFDVPMVKGREETYDMITGFTEEGVLEIIPSKRAYSGIQRASNGVTHDPKHSPVTKGATIFPFGALILTESPT